MHTDKKLILDQVVGLDDLDSISLSFGKGDTVHLHGDLGAGKTTLIRKFVGDLVDQPIEVTSPTYTYYQEYGDGIFHFDLYRVESEEHFIAIGGQEIFERDDVICFIEWPDRARLDPPTYAIYLDEIGDQDTRRIRIYQ